MMNMLSSCQLIIQEIVLLDIAESLSCFIDIFKNIFAVNDYFSFILLQIPRNDLQECGFSAAVASQESINLVLLNSYANLMQPFI